MMCAYVALDMEYFIWKKKLLLQKIICRRVFEMNL